MHRVSFPARLMAHTTVLTRSDWAEPGTLAVARDHASRRRATRIGLRVCTEPALAGGLGAGTSIPNAPRGLVAHGARFHFWAALEMQANGRTRSCQDDTPGGP